VKTIAQIFIRDKVSGVAKVWWEGGAKLHETFCCRIQICLELGNRTKSLSDFVQLYKLTEEN